MALETFLRVVFPDVTVIRHSSLLSCCKIPFSKGFLHVFTAFSCRRKVLVSFCKDGYKSESRSTTKKVLLHWTIFKRWDVPWDSSTICLTSLACGLSFLSAELIGSVVFPPLTSGDSELNVDRLAGILLADQGFKTTLVLRVMYYMTNGHPHTDDFFRHDLREPFRLKNGWLLWAGIGYLVSLFAVAFTGIITSILHDDGSPKEADALTHSLPLIGASSFSTACLIGMTGILAPILEETVFRGFLMTSLTKWMPTPLSVLVSATVFALAHLSPADIPQFFVFGTVLGISYAQTRNLLTPIIIHALWNSGVIAMLVILQLKGHDIKEFLHLNPAWTNSFIDVLMVTLA